MAVLDALDWEERERESAAFRAERDAEREIDQAVDASEDLVRTLTHAVLLANGYHTH